MKKSFFVMFVISLLPPAWAAISKVQSAATWNSFGTTCNVTLNGTTGGNLIVLWLTWSPSSLTLNLGYTDPTGNKYASAVGPTVQSVTNTAAQIVYAKSIGGGNDNIKFPFANGGSATSVSCVAVEYSGADTLNPLDSVSEAISNSAGNTLDSGTVAPANASLLVFGGGTSDTGTPIAGSGFTAIQANGGSLTEQNTNPITANNTLQRATACLGSGVTCSAATGNWIMQMAVFRAATWTTAGGYSTTRAHRTVYDDQFPGAPDTSVQISNAARSLGSSGGIVRCNWLCRRAADCMVSGSVGRYNGSCDFQARGSDIHYECADHATWGLGEGMGSGPQTYVDSGWQYPD